MITGAASGLGRAFAIELAKAPDATIIIADVDMDGAEETARRVRALRATAHVVRCDVREWAQVEHLSSEAERLCGRVDLLVNNAGVAAGGQVGEIPLEDWRWAVDINFWGVVYGCRAFLPAMKKRGRGWVLNIASAAGYASLPNFAPYNTTKAAVISLTETLTAELWQSGVSATVVCPTFFQTNIAESSRGDDKRTRNIARLLMRRSRKSADDVAKAAIKDLERRRIYSLPMIDARAVWLARRFLPAQVHRVLIFAQKNLERSMRDQLDNME